MNRIADVRGRVVGDFTRQTGGQFAFDLLHLHAHALDHVNRVRVRQNVDPHEHRFLPGETHFGVVIFRAEHHIRDIAQSDQSPFVLAYDEFLEIVRSVQIGVRR